MIILEFWTLRTIHPGIFQYIIPLSRNSCSTWKVFPFLLSHFKKRFIIYCTDKLIIVPQAKHRFLLAISTSNHSRIHVRLDIRREKHEIRALESNSSDHPMSSKKLLHFLKFSSPDSFLDPVLPPFLSQFLDWWLQHIGSARPLSLPLHCS